MPETNYREAMRAAHREAMQRDARVFVMGEDVGRYGGSYAVTKGLLAEFGEQRVRDTPLSELGFVGAGVGAALGGLRPIVEVMTVNFSLLALDAIVNSGVVSSRITALLLILLPVLLLCFSSCTHIAALDTYMQYLYCYTLDT